MSGMSADDVFVDVVVNDVDVVVDVVVDWSTGPLVVDL